MFELFLGLMSLGLFGGHVYDLHLQRRPAVTTTNIEANRGANR